MDKYYLKPEVETKLRDYQWELALPGLSGQNYIVCAPTGSGKTTVAGLVISEHLKNVKGRGKVLFVVNRVSLAQQQRTALQDMIQGAKLEEVAGNVAPHKKAMLSASLQGGSDSPEDEGVHFQLDSDIIVCTAGCLFNELKNKRVTLSSISLLVIDECHNAHKNTDYARIMEIYIRAKMSDNTAQLPQVMGLTATPGAGDTARPTLITVLDHLIALCAVMDATGGIQIVSKNICELKLHQASAACTTATPEGRPEDEPFIAVVVKVITMLEDVYKKLEPPSESKWSHNYTEWINRTLLDSQRKGKNRDKISILRTLKSLSSTLKVYHNLAFEDAMAELDKLAFPSTISATGMEQNLSKVTSQLKVRLQSLEKVENPLLLQLEAVLVENFTRSPESKALIFVETKVEAASINRWIKSRGSLENVHSDLVTGQTSGTVTGKKMTKAEQNDALNEFRGGECNLLVCTSVLEEGIDVPACNLVIRYQKVTSEIAQVQSRGRARASDSHSITIVTSQSGKQFQELLNDEKNALVDQALEVLPVGEGLRGEMQTKQGNILKEWDRKKEDEAKNRTHVESLEVDIHCLNCSNFLCNGSHVCTIPNTSHYVVTSKEFLMHAADIQTHPNPAYEPEGLSRTHKLFCKECKVQSLGVMGRWWDHPAKYPVLKCSNIKFKIAGKKEFVPCKKWKAAPFSVPSLKL